MQRQKAMIASAIIAVTLMTGAVAYAAIGLTDGPRDNVGNLQPVAPPATNVLVSADPTAGSVTTPPSVPTTVTPSGSHHDGDSDGSGDSHGDSGSGGRHDD